MGSCSCRFEDRHGLAQVVKLLDSGADIDRRNERGRTPLTAAAAYGQRDIARLLLDRGADINCELATGASPLAIAAMEGHSEIVALLLDQGANVDADATRKRMAHLSLRHGAIPSVDALNLMVNPQTGRPSGIAVPFVLAAENGHTATVELLLKRGADINAPLETGETALVQAAREGHLDVVRLLLNSGADVDAAAEDGSSPLTQAAQYGHIEIVRLLLEKGADINQRAGGSTARRHAEHNGHREIVNVLREHEAK